MGTLSSMAVYLYRKDKKYQCEVTIAIEKSTYLISVFILTRFLDHPPTQETSEDLSGERIGPRDHAVLQRGR